MGQLFYCGNQWGYTPLGNNVVIPPNVDCQLPDNLQTEVQGQYVTFKWTIPHNYTKFVLEYGLQSGSVSDNTVDVFGTSIKLRLDPNEEYQWRVKTICIDPGGSGFQTGTNVTTGDGFPDCTAVSSVTITNMGTFYRASWTATGAQYYKVQWATLIGNNPTILEATTQNVYYDIPFIQGNQNYQVRVIGICEDPNLQPVPSPWTEFETGALACEKPTNLNYTASSTAIVFSWFGPAGKTFNIYLNGNQIAGDYPSNTFTLSGLTPGTNYNIEIRTNCINAFSEVLQATIKTKETTCNDPVMQAVSGITPTGFTINWTPAGGIVSQQVILDNGAPIALGAGVNTYNFTNLPSGSNHVVVVRSICTSSVSSGVSTAVSLTGCAAPTNLQATPGPTYINIKWNGTANASEYLVVVKRNSDNVTVFTGTAILQKITANGLAPGVLYDISITARCGAAGTTLVNSAALTGQATTTAADACENAVIIGQTITQFTAGFTFNFASGRTTGNIKYVLRDNGTNAIVDQATLTDIGTHTSVGLLANTQYKLFIYNEVTTDGITCVPAQLLLFTTTAVCQPPTSPTATLQTNDTEILVDAVASVSTPPTYNIQIQTIGDTTWTDKGDHTLPYTITGITPGRYKVRIRSNCPASNSAYVETDGVCTKPIIQVSAVNQNIAQIAWTSMLGALSYTIELRSLAGGTASYSTSGTSISIPNLAWNTNFVGVLKVECAPGVFVSSDPFTIATGNESGAGGGDNGICQPADFSAFIQDCSITDPGGVDHPGGDPNPPGNAGCQVISVDWENLSAIFLPVTNDAPNDTFIEVTLSFGQNNANGVVALMPGGLMARVSDGCKPNTTLTLPYEIVEGGTYITGDVTIAPNGNITISGSYTANGADSLIIRARGNYIKA